MHRFTSRATRDEHGWEVRCDQEPDVLTHVAELRDAAVAQRWEIARVTGISHNEIHVVVSRH